MAQGRNYDFVKSSPTEESLPPYSSTWVGEVPEEKVGRKFSWASRTLSWPSQHGWKEKCRTVTRRAKSAIITAWIFARDRAWPIATKTRISWKQATAFILVVVFAILPMVFLGYFTPMQESSWGYRPFYGIFEAKVMGCGDSFGTPENSTIKGIASLFVLDQTFGRFTFGQVKTLDVAWDVLVGRGAQLLAWWIGYNVFSDSLLRIIERHAASFQIFQRIALEGPSLLSLWTLVKELWCTRSKRTRFLFFYIWVSTLYIICIPMWLGAMTGYDSTSIAWVSLDESNNIVPSAALERTVYVSGTWDTPFKEPVCVNYSLSYPILSSRYMRNKTRPVCRFDFPGNNQTFNEARYDYSLKDKMHPCGSSLNVTINGKDYDALALNATDGWCHDSTPYDYLYLFDKTRCLPDTANPSYQWGFSTMLSGLFVFFHFGWAFTMYVVWQDAQFNSSLVKSGYEMTPLRAAFAMAKAAKRRTGMGEKQLVMANTKEMQQELYGTRKTKGTSVDYRIFADGDEEDVEEPNTLVRRTQRGKQEGGFSEVSLSSESSSTLGAR
ncbi:hypothetical protein EK21DRAFT_69767 [Setomelanomma holmii]|uniref:Uncharacterized protein n=1 Tax=Setomelanomma holmii TaxID=210430 RepID=A0A9P4H5A0_9PLEO|nr:hypothetical protein EK21DRAFT_69767 [Setomelanomma holmii]